MRDRLARPRVWQRGARDRADNGAADTSSTGAVPEREARQVQAAAHVRVRHAAAQGRRREGQAFGLACGAGRRAPVTSLTVSHQETSPATSSSVRHPRASANGSALRVFLDTNVLVSAFATRGICAVYFAWSSPSTPA